MEKASKNRNNYRLILLAWCIIGVLLGGYYIIYPEYSWLSFKVGDKWHYYNFHIGIIILIVTVIGALLIHAIHRQPHKILKLLINIITYVHNNIRKMNYRKILVIWCSLGILIGGYYVIYPIERYETIWNEYYKVDYDKKLPSKHEGEFIILLTVVGAILIFGFGRIKEIEKNKSKEKKE